MEQRNYETGKKASNKIKQEKKKRKKKPKNSKKQKLLIVGSTLLIANQILAMAAGATIDDYFERKNRIEDGEDYIRNKYKDLPNVYYQPSDIGGVHLMVDGLSIAKFDSGASISKEQAIPYIVKEMEKIDPNVTLAEKYVIALDLVEGNMDIVEKYLGKISKQELEDKLLWGHHMSAIENLGGKIDYENNNEENQKSGGHAR